MIWKLEENYNATEEELIEINTSNTQYAELSLMCFIKVL